AGFASSTLVVRYSPSAAVSSTNALTFISNGGNITNTLTGTGALLPAANFTGSPTNAVRPLTVTFTDSSTGTITNRFWNFGDGATTNTPATTLTHTYNLAATNTVILTVTGPLGSNTLTRAAYIVATNPPPVLSVSPASLNFGSLIIGQSNTLTFQVVNSGAQNLNGTATTVAPFTILGGSPINLAPGQTGLVSVAFAPASAAIFNNSVVFTSNGGNSTNSVTGVGLTPSQLVILPASLDFGTVAIGANP